MMLLRTPGIELAHGDHRGLVGDVEAARDDGLEGRHDLATDDDGVDPGPGLGTVRLSTLDDDLEAVRGGEERPLRYPRTPLWNLGEDVQAEDDVDLRGIEDALLQHQLGSGRLVGQGHALLGGLEDEDDLAGEVPSHRHQRLRSVEQDGDVGVVAAGVHDSDGLALPGCGCLAGERQVHLLGDGEGVHVGPQRHHGARPASLDHGDDAGLGHSGPRLETKGAESFGDELRCLDLVVPELWIPVQVAAPLDHC